MSEPRVELTDAELKEGLRACLSVPRWVEEVADAGPFGSLDELLEIARTAASPLTGAEIDQAMAHHPRIGDKATGHGAAQTFARAEQQSSASDDEQLARALAAGNAAYEQRFDRVFLIRAAGRSRSEILDELDRRLLLNPEEELAIVGAELRDIALLRMPQLFAHLDAHSGFDESDAAR